MNGVGGFNGPQGKKAGEAAVLWYETHKNDPTPLQEELQQQQPPQQQQLEQQQQEHHHHQDYATM